MPFSEVVAAVGSVRGEPWESFVNRHGDWGRDLAKGKGVVIRHRTKKMLHIQFDLIDATIPRQLGNDEMFSMKIAS